MNNPIQSVRSLTSDVVFVVNSFLIMLFMFAFFLTILTGCGSSEKTSDNIETNGNYTIAVIPKGTTHEFWKSVHAGALTAATTDAGFPGSVNLTADWLAVAMQSGDISLFYVDDAATAGVIAQYDTGTGTWEVSSPDNFTSSAVPRALALAAGGGKLFAAYDDGAFTRIRAYQ